MLGQLFRSTVKSNVKSELIVFLTPRIVNSADDAQRIRQEIENKTSQDTRVNGNDFLNRGNNDGPQRKLGRVCPRPTSRCPLIKRRPKILRPPRQPTLRSRRAGKREP